MALSSSLFGVGALGVSFPLVFDSQSSVQSGVVYVQCSDVRDDVVPPSPDIPWKFYSLNALVRSVVFRQF